MKKFLITALTVSILSSVPVFAYTNDVSENTDSENILSVEEIKNNAPTYIEGEIKEIKEEGITVIAKEENTTIDTEGLIVLNLNGDVLNTSDIKIGDTVRFYEQNNTLIDFSLIEDSISNCVIDEFKPSQTLGDYESEANSLALYVDEDTPIFDTKGNKLTESDLEGNYSAVFYDYTTMSIPAVTNPIKIVVLGGVPVSLPELEYPEETPDVTEAPEASPEVINVDFNEYELDKSEALEENGITVVPVRKIAEELGYEVLWNNDERSVSIGTTAMGVSFKIGENSYSKSKAAAFVLSAAPVIIDDKTYVPVDFFEQILETKIVLK